MKTKNQFDGSVVSELKKEGFNVKVYHGRNFVNDKGQSICMSRRDMGNESPEVQKSFVLQSKGGFTQVTIEKDGKAWSAKCNVPKTQQFYRRKGIYIAANKALKKM